MQQRTQRRGEAVAQSRADLEMLSAQRGELQEQARQLAERRNVLFSQARNMPVGAARGELESRMSEIDARLARLDDQIARLNDRIVEAMGRVGATPGPVVVDVPRVNVPQISIPPFNFPRQRGPDMREVGGIMAAEAVMLALIGLAFWRFGMRRMRHHFERAFANQANQLNQLQQAVDVIGVEVERISEGQRYVAKVLVEGSPGASGLPAARRAAEPAPSSRDG